MKTELILAARQFKHNNPSASLNIEVCNYKRFGELVRDSSVCIRRFSNITPIKVFYYA